MITPNAKCVVNGPKVNEVIDSLNPLLQMTCVVGDVIEPTVQYSDSSVQIVIPPSGGVEFNQLLDIVGADNTVESRYFATGDSPNGGGGGGSNSIGIGTSAGRSAGAGAGASGSQSKRDSLEGAGSSSQRDSMSQSPQPGGADSSSGGSPNSDSGGGGKTDQLDSYMSNLATNIAQTSSQLRKAKKDDKQKWNQKEQMWEFKKFGDPASANVTALTKRLKSFKQQYEKAKSKRDNA